MGRSVKMIENHYGHVNTVKHTDRVLMGIGSWDAMHAELDAPCRIGSSPTVCNESRTNGRVPSMVNRSRTDGMKWRAFRAKPWRWPDRGVRQTLP
jgi:hypothetical protein